MPSRSAPPQTLSVKGGLTQERRYKPTTIDFAVYPPGYGGTQARQRANRASTVNEARGWTWDEIMHDEF